MKFICNKQKFKKNVYSEAGMKKYHISKQTYFNGCVYIVAWLMEKINASTQDLHLQVEPVCFFLPVSTDAGLLSHVQIEK
jgi:hypothetical protein